MSEELYHYGVPGMKWGVRKYRELKGRRTIKKLEKQRQKYYSVLNSPRKLMKYNRKYSAEQIDAQIKKLESVKRLQEQISENDAASYEARNTIRAKKLEFKNKKKEEKLRLKKLKEEVRAKKLANDAYAKNPNGAQNQNQNNDAKAQKLADNVNKWQNRAKKIKNIYEYSKTAKSMLDDFGLTDPRSGKSLLGSLGVSLGFKDIKASDKGGTKEKAQKTENAKENRESGTVKAEKKEETRTNKASQDIIKNAKKNLDEAKKKKASEIKDSWTVSSVDIPKDAKSRINNATVKIKNGSVASVPTFSFDKRYKSSREWNKASTSNVVLDESFFKDLWK